VLAGAVTHLAWDGFTHEGARGVRMFPALDDSVAAIGGHPMIAFHVMQLVSSVVGLVVVLWVLWRALRGDAIPPLPHRSLEPSQRHFWRAAYGLAALAASAVYFWLIQSSEGHRFSLGAVTNEAAIAALRGLALALVGVSLVLRLRLASTPPSIP
jgi:hypothetical protein